MAGRLTISTLNDDTGVLATQNGMSGIAKAWVNFNGFPTVSIRASMNVGSLTYNGTGDYTLNFTTAMPDANYSVIGSSRNSTTRMTIFCPSTLTSSPLTTTSARVRTAQDDGTVNDSDIVCVAVFR